jgi:hypothetical protein
MQTGVSVHFVSTNVSKCLCFRCPVQTSSTCVSSKLMEIKETTNKQPLLHEDIPGVYCAAGAAMCLDIKPEYECMCGKCVIFPEYKLFNYQPMGHYCRDGSAK